MARKKVSECKFGSEYNDDIGETIHTSLEPASEFFGQKFSKKFQKNKKGL